MFAARGTWIYGGAVEMPVDIIGLPFDFWYELAKTDDRLEPNEEPNPLNSDGVLLYVRFRDAGRPLEKTWPDSPGYTTLMEAKAHAESRVPSPITWKTPAI